MTRARGRSPLSRTASSPRTGAEELRLLVSNLDYTSESFNDRWTLEQLVQLHRMLQASEWDILPDVWTERQVDEALAGIPPSWDDDENPVYDDQRAAHEACDCGCEDGRICAYGKTLGIVQCTNCREAPASGEVKLCVYCQTVVKGAIR